MKKRYFLPLATIACASWLLPVPASAASAPVSEIAERPIAGNVTIARPDFGREMPEHLDKKLLGAMTWRLAPAEDELLLPEEAAPETVTIFGSAEAEPEQMEAYIERRNPHPKLNCTVKDLVRYYYEEAGREGIRPDVALCQALKETGVPSQNNFCGLGTTGGGVRGAAFDTPQLGVRAHIQHLLAYASAELPHEAVVDPRYELIVQYRPDIHGSIRTWTGLNGVWAVPGKTYGQDILRLWAAAKAPDASDAALAAAEKRVRQAPDEAAGYLYRGIVQAKRGALGAARADFETAARYDATGTALYDLAALQTKTGDAKAAAKTYDALLDAHPTFSAAAWYGRGLLYLDGKKPQPAKAEACFYHAMNCNPQGAAAQNAIAVAELRQKHYEKAWTALETAAQINNADVDVLANQIVFAACVKKK